MTVLPTMQSAQPCEEINGVGPRQEGAAGR